MVEKKEHSPIWLLLACMMLLTLIVWCQNGINHAIIVMILYTPLIFTCHIIWQSVTKE